MAGACTGYQWSHGQYQRSNCSQESSTFFIILGFTMLVLLVLLGLILVIACFRRNRRASASASSGQSGAPGSTDDCVIQMNGAGAGAGYFYGKDLEAVKCVIMAGEDKPTFLAHPVAMSLVRDENSKQEEKNIGETSKQQQQSVEMV
ncbi:hypothetical protein MPTK1_1g08490 [Marchantia polymorpha subsp. ruderalis]|uniref:Uncharacterized protein n=2 Tax=Marchantia polymorpha TaxID=3197 RepID=A0AAF6AMY7_MARPO|nr:hypothetical protein MARPO_0036s0092 [Marchantia polymorpha]BBM97807.1 hypothetical protein Mp_1g08490 [Marchantia polymorpha subsp. ruderalis]|eukprot:PTQ41111.1 hypothetical protein MARPO_0036s0092 [Marchantia polymorpha]